MHIHYINSHILKGLTHIISAFTTTVEASVAVCGYFLTKAQ